LLLLLLLQKQGSPSITNNPCDDCTSVPWFMYKQHSLTGDTNRKMIISLQIDEVTFTSHW